MTATPDIKVPVRPASELFTYSVIADRGYASGVGAFIRYEQHTLIAIILASLLLTFYSETTSATGIRLSISSERLSN